MTEISPDQVRRFAILEHRVGIRFRRPGNKAVAAGAVHWDWLFDLPHTESRPSTESSNSSEPGGLATWATDPLPQSMPGARRFPPGTYQALRLPDHRRRYLDYEGDIGGGRGTVTKLAGGSIVTYDLGRQAASRDLVHLTVKIEQSATLQIGVRLKLEWQLRMMPSAETNRLIGNSARPSRSSDQSSEIVSSEPAPPPWTLRLG
ncbi:hypothetical protein [Roseiconus lacunae]|uniref:DUF2169 domain-containing protein n=1 Tax=Roseiconus lacunae TaxID=2605694 RepID=A0ABT7PQE4_9BACT|nr:hypothetical protein [Roseiconus lacunae]MDM4018730.1 hypothetical protein [Roseiconus lacunae]